MNGNNRHTASTTASSTAKLAAGAVILVCLAVAGMFAFKKASRRSPKTADATSAALTVLRGAVQEFYGATEGRFPATLDELKPYLPGGLVPAARTAAHASSAAVQYVSGPDFRAGRLADTGGWVYVNSPAGDDDLGMVAVNCSHARTQGGLPWNKL